MAFLLWSDVDFIWSEDFGEDRFVVCVSVAIMDNIQRSDFCMVSITETVPYGGIADWPIGFSKAIKIIQIISDELLEASQVQVIRWLHSEEK